MTGQGCKPTYSTFLTLFLALSTMCSPGCHSILTGSHHNSCWRDASGCTTCQPGSQEPQGPRCREPQGPNCQRQQRPQDPRCADDLLQGGGPQDPGPQHQQQGPQQPTAPPHQQPQGRCCCCHHCCHVPNCCCWCWRRLPPPWCQGQEAPWPQEWTSVQPGPEGQQRQQMQRQQQQQQGTQQVLKPPGGTLTDTHCHQPVSVFLGACQPGDSGLARRSTTAYDGMKEAVGTTVWLVPVAVLAAPCGQSLWDSVVI